MLLADSLAGQSFATGQVVRLVGGNPIPIPGIAVVLHRVGGRSQGPLDTVRAGRGGRFEFRFSADTGAAYLLSARHNGVEYFTAPLATNPARPDTGIMVIVADTSSNAPVVLRQRTLLISEPDETGTRAVIDWFVLTNPGDLTRVAPDTLHPSWGSPLPSEAQNVELADSRLSQFAPEALTIRRDSVWIVAPISPGDKELMLQYRIPGRLRKFNIPAAGATDSVFVLLEGKNSSVPTRGFTSVDSQSIEGRVFQRWAGTVPSGGDIQVSLPAPPFTSPRLLALLAGLAAVTFVWFGARVVRRRMPAPLRPTADSPERLADAAARLDARFEGREATTPPEEWSRYLAERARLKAELVHALAASRRRS